MARSGSMSALRLEADVSGTGRHVGGGPTQGERGCPL